MQVVDLLYEVCLLAAAWGGGTNVQDTERFENPTALMPDLLNALHLWGSQSIPDSKR